MQQRYDSKEWSVESGPGVLRRFLAASAAIVLLTGAAGAQSISGKVSDAESGQPLAGARVSVGSGAQGAIVRADGTYRLPVSVGTQIIRVAAIGYTPVRDTVIVGAGGASRDYRLVKGTQTLDANVVIGTRTSDRTILNAPVPVDVLTSVEIKQTGATETSQILQLLAPSFNFPRPTISDGTDHVRPSMLRGLGPDQVLVLVNGKRRHTSALVNVNGTIGRGSTGVDLNAIPAASIERIEILRDGAAAQYGSDAIAGVINIILKSDPVTDLGVQVGSNYTKLEGYPEDKHLTDGDVTSIDASTGMNLTGGGFFHATGQYNNRGSTNRSLGDPRTQYFAGNPKNTDPNYTNQIHFRQGDAHVNDLGLVLNAALPTMSSGAQIYAYAIGGRRNGQGAGNWRLPNGDNTVRAIFPDGFLPLINSTIDDYAGTLGVRGEISRWRYDLSGVYGRNSFEFDITNTNNATMGGSSPTEFYAGKLKFAQATANLDLVRAFSMAAFFSPLNVAIGAEARRDMYGIEEGEPGSYIDGGVKILDGPKAGAQPAPGAQVFPGFQPGDASDHSRTNFAGYVDLETHLLRDLLVGVAGRTEHYSDFGGTTTGKATMRYEFIPGYALRGAISTGFRAPSLSQEFYSSTATNFLNLGAGLVPVEVRTLPVESGPAKALGAEPLKAEKSVNASIGLALAPLQNLTFTADYYNITIKDRIVFSGNFTGAAMTNFLASQGFPGVGSARFFTNAIDTHTAGIDLVGRYAVDFGNAGVSRFTGGYNHTKTRVTHVDSTAAALKAQNSILFDRVERGRIEIGQPHETISATLDHTLRRIAANLHVQRFGEVGFRGSFLTDTLDQTFGAKWITDLNASYSVLRQLRLTVGANNLFDVYPDKQIRGNSNSGIFPYSNTVTTFGFNGRFVYVKARYEL
ncbi:MAG: TonB-dependent receptor [Gemmatimonadales bacterium]